MAAAEGIAEELNWARRRAARDGDGESAARGDKARAATGASGDVAAAMASNMTRNA